MACTGKRHGPERPFSGAKTHRWGAMLQQWHGVMQEPHNKDGGQVRRRTVACSAICGSICSNREVVAEESVARQERDACPQILGHDEEACLQREVRLAKHMSNSANVSSASNASERKISCMEDADDMRKDLL